MSFDIGFLINNNFNIGDFITYDTMYMARRAKKNGILEVENCKLKTLKEYYGIKNESHNSLNDVLTTHKIYEDLIRKGLNRHKSEYLIEYYNKCLHDREEYRKQNEKHNEKSYDLKQNLKQDLNNHLTSNIKKNKINDNQIIKNKVKKENNCEKINSDNFFTKYSLDENLVDILNNI